MDTPKLFHIGKMPCDECGADLSVSADEKREVYKLTPVFAREKAVICDLTQEDAVCPICGTTLTYEVQNLESE